MVDFSSVNLRILSPDGKNVLAELQTLDRTNVRTARNIGTAQTAAISQVQTKSATAARQIAGNIAMVAAQGEVSAAALKNVVSQFANIGFMFGTGGAIAGAIGLTGLAIHNLFDRTRKEIEETRKKFEDELARMVNAGDVALMKKQAQDIFLGTPAKQFEDGIRALEARRLPIQTMLDNAIEAGNKIMQGRLQRDLDAIDKELTPLLLKFERLRLAILDITNAPFQVPGLTPITSSARAPGAGARDEASVKAATDRLLEGMLPSVGVIGGDKHVGTDMTEFVAAMLGGIQDALKRAPPLPPTEITPELERIIGIDAVAENIGGSFGETLANAIGAGVSAGIGGGGFAGGFRALTGSVLQAIGGMFQQIGVASLAGLKFMAAIEQAIKKFAPGLGIAASVGLIALGATLSAIGGSMGGSGRSFGGGGGGFGGGGFTADSSTIIDRGMINPLNPLSASGTVTARPMVNLYATVFGVDDAQAQRQLRIMMDKALARSGESL